MKITKIENTALIEFETGHRHNPFSGKSMDRLNDCLVELNQDQNIKSIILYGGNANSFSVGGDFNEVSNFKGGSEVDQWIDSVNSLYKAVLSLSKPIIAAIDNYAIGFGLQLALTCDYRIASTDAELKMPEFAMGISCNFGGFLLEKIVSRTVMQYMVFGCEAVKADQALSFGLVHEVCTPKLLLEKAITLAQKFANYPTAPIIQTKPTINNHIISGLDDVCVYAKIAHSKCFAEGAAQKNMHKIIKK